jgi:transposase InsO family protein
LNSSAAALCRKLALARARADYASLEWVDWFNHRRLLEPIGNIPPAEAEEQYYAAAENLDMAA